MKNRIDEGLWGWKQTENHNHMMQLQRQAEVSSSNNYVELAYFGQSAFLITAPSGLSVMIDPWRNSPKGNWDWYHYDFPSIEVDIAISTHAHFDHDGVHVLSSSVILDRLIGSYTFADVKIIGIADKHVSDSTHNKYDWAELTRRLTPIETNPEDNHRSFDNCLIIMEVAGLRILHWGDNRPNPPQSVWDMIGEIDILLLPVDGSQHILSNSQADEVAERVKAKVIVPHHYAIWDVTTRGSTLLPPDEWVNGRAGSVWLDKGSVRLDTSYVQAQNQLVLCFGDNVAFDKTAARAMHR